MTDPAPAPSSSPEPPAKSPQEALREQVALDAQGLACRNVDYPLYPELGPRCVRCGERLRDVKPGPVDASVTCPRCKVAVRTPEAGALLVPRGEASRLREVLRGASYLPRGAFRVLRSPSLWKFAAVPLVLNILVVLLAFFLAGVIANWLKAAEPQGWEGWFWGTLSVILSFVSLAVKVLTFVLLPIIVSCLIVAFPFGILYKLMFMPFMELLTEATERLVLGISEATPFDFGRFYANLVIAIVDALFLSLLQGLLYLLLLPINFVPLLGSVVWMIVPPAVFAGMDYSDMNLVRRGYTTREKIRLWRTHDWRFLGYGIAFFFFLTLPFVNALVIPAAAAGGALLYLELERK